MDIIIYGKNCNNDNGLMLFYNALLQIQGKVKLMKSHNSTKEINNSRGKEIITLLLTILMLLIFYIAVSIIQGNIHGRGNSISVNSTDLDFNVMELEEGFPETTYVNVDEATGIIEYGSPSMRITIEPIVNENPNLRMWISTIRIQEASQLKSAFAGDEFSLKNREKTSDIAARHEAVFAVNGAAAGFNERSYVIRDGVIYRATDLDCPPLIIKENGDFAIFGYGELSGEEILGMGGVHTYDFGPDLIKDYEISDYGDGWYKKVKDPRTAIGQKGPLEYVVIVADGRSKKSDGASFYDLALEFQKRGCRWAYALDGGGSTTLYFNGKVLNEPSDWSGEREISDILYFVGN